MKTYPLFKAHVDVQAAMTLIEGVLRSGYINEGTQVSQLCDALQGKLGAERLVLTNSCTSALTLALHMSDVGPGDHVASTPMTCVATNTPISTAGATISWVDVDPLTGMMDPASLERLVSTQHVKAVVAVAWAGVPPHLDRLGAIARSAGARFILDAAHAFGANYHGRPIHRWADFTCYSFQAIKHFTTGDGGALVCDSWREHARSNALKWFGLDRDRAKDAQGNWRGQQWDVDIHEAGYKFNMNNLAAAVGLSQLPHIDGLLARHRRNAVVYDNLLGDSQIVRPIVRPTDCEPSFWVYTVTLDPTRSLLSRDQLLQALNAEGIMAGVVHVPNDAYTCFVRCPHDHLKGLRLFSENQLSLPCGWWLDDDDVKHIARRVQELVT